MKIVINRCHGGYGLSHEAVMRYFDLKGITVYPEKNVSWAFWTYWLVTPEHQVEKKDTEAFYSMSMDERRAYNQTLSDQTFEENCIDRDDEVLVQVVEELGESASGDYAELAVVEIPDDVEWEISEYDGREHVAEKHRTWY
jgi:hypothetical protein